MSSLPARPTHPADNLPVLGTAHQWRRDFSLLGALIGGLAPAIMWTVPWLGVPLSLAGAALGALTGARFGLLLRSQTNTLRGSLPIPAMMLYLPLLGGLWGGLVAGTAGALTAGSFALLAGELTAALAIGAYGGALSAVVGAMVGAAVVGLLWFPYAFLSVMRQRRWPVFVGAAVMAPLAAPLLAVLLGGL